MRANGLVSKTTFMVYLNGDFVGGETVFREKGVEPGSPGECSIRPQQGMALFFRHKLWHEGKNVEQGTKYVLRSDVFYEAEPELRLAKPKLET